MTNNNASAVGISGKINHIVRIIIVLVNKYRMYNVYRNVLKLNRFNF